MRSGTFQRFPFWGGGYFCFVEGVVEGEGVVFDVLGDAVDLVLGFVDLDLRVGAGDGVDFSALLLLLEDGALADADCQLGRRGGTLRSLLLACGESSFSLNLLFSIISSKSMSTFLPLCRL